MRVYGVPDILNPSSKSHPPIVQLFEYRRLALEDLESSSIPMCRTPRRSINANRRALFRGRLKLKQGTYDQIRLRLAATSSSSKTLASSRGD